MKTIPIGEASEDQLRLFAINTLGIDIKASAKKETVLARIQAAWNKPDIAIAESESEADSSGSMAVPQPVTGAQQAPADGMVRLTIGVTEEAGGSDRVQLGVNGKVMLVPRGEVVEIPEAFFESLVHAVQDKYESMRDGGMNPVPMKVQLYPFQVLVSTEFTERLMREAA